MFDSMVLRLEPFLAQTISLYKGNNGAPAANNLHGLSGDVAAMQTLMQQMGGGAGGSGGGAGAVADGEL